MSASSERSSQRKANGSAVTPRRGKNCSAGCPTRDHKTWGECVRGKRLNLNPNLSDTGRQKSWDKELDAYDSARRQGVEPEGTTMTKVEEAMRKAEASS